jgi:hypothetical protein
MGSYLLNFEINFLMNFRFFHKIISDLHLPFIFMLHVTGISKAFEVVGDSGKVVHGHSSPVCVCVLAGGRVGRKVMAKHHIIIFNVRASC